MNQSRWAVLMIPLFLVATMASFQQQQHLRAAPVHQSAQFGATPQTVRQSSRSGARVIPTTSNPVGNGTTASRTYANTSFEQSDYACFSTFNSQHWAYVGMDKMRGWYTAHSPWTETNCPGNMRSGQRVIELQTNRNGINNPYEGNVFAELNANEASFIYQKLCMQSGESFDFSFHHKTLSASRSDILLMRFGIPSGLPSGAVAADSYNRPVMYGKTSSDGSRYATSASYTGISFGGSTFNTPSGTTSPAGTVTTTNGWAEYSGTHTLPNDGNWDGVFNLGFQAVDGDSPTGGNLLDGIAVGLSPVVDLGASRDTSAGEQTTPNALRIRINGRVPAGMAIALTAPLGDATSDTDYALGTASAGAYGTATTTHTTGSTTWVFDIPAGDYDGGVVPANNKGGLTIPLTYTYDRVSEGDEYVKFVISNPGSDGGTSNWQKGDPTCDTSEKNDGVVYTITNVDPTSTPTNTATNTATPTMTYTPTMTATNTKTPSPTLKTRAPGEVPTTSNPTINTANAGVRTMANTSFEVTDSACSLNTGTWAYIRQEWMAGWFTAHPLSQESCNNNRSGPVSYRPIELNPRSDSPDGRNVASLNAEVASFLYQKLCVSSGETFSFEFYHNAGVAGSTRTDVAALRMGIPSGLPSGSVAADSYNREIIRASTTTNSAGVATSASKTDSSGTTSSAASVDRNWGKYSGTHTLPATGYDGIRNIGFFGIDSIGAGAGNLLDKISLGLTPLIDMGSSRDATILEGAAGSVNIRINGRVGAGTIVVLRKREGTATSDSDFTIGTISAGSYGNASVTHTSGSDIRTIAVPAGDYDGGIFASNNKGGLTIPVSYLYDVTNDSGEYVMFQLGAPGDDGATADWQLSDPTCDGSFKDDGVVHSITNLAPTATNTATATNTNTPTLTPTATNTPTATATPAGQYIVFGTPSDKIEDGLDFDLNATSSVGLTVSYVSTTPTVCTVTPTGKVTIVSAGDCTITASAPSGTVSGVSYAAAPDVSRTFKIKSKQTITFPTPSDKLYNAADFALSAIASSTLPITYTSSTPTVCTVTTSGTVDLVSPGLCSISANQSGGTVGRFTYAAAPAVVKSFNVNALPQAITFASPGEKLAYEGDFDLIGSASSTLTLVYTSSTPAVCTVTGKRVVYLSVGKCTITATQAGGTKAGTIYAEATPITRDFFFADYTPTPTLTASNTRTLTPTLTPTAIPFLLKKGAVGASFVLGLLQNDTLVTWGMNREYQANIPPCCGTGIQDIAVGTNFALALKGGRVFGWGANTKGQLVFPAKTAKDITAIAAGGAHGLALTKAGAVIAWGDNGFKQASVPKGLKPVSAMAGGANHTVVILKDGSVAAWGSNSSNQAKPPTTLKNIRQVAAGLDHSLALKTDGTVVSWGNNTYGQAAIPSNAIDVKQVSAGTQFSMAVKNDGTVLAWGRNDYNQIIIPTEYKDVYSAFAGYANTILGLRSGRIVVLGAQTDGVDASRTPTKSATPTPEYVFGR